MKRPRASAIAAVLFAVGALFVSAAPAGAAGRPDLTPLRTATDRFHDLSVTLASGRVDLHLCVDQMGEHFADPNSFSDGVLDPIDPEAMVYAHTEKGLRLVAVEWVSTTPGAVMDIPLHFNPDVGLFVLHAWVWTHNPDGMFADMNPRIRDCP
jgi:hypothetical protein